MGVLTNPHLCETKKHQTGTGNLIFRSSPLFCFQSWTLDGQVVVFPYPFSASGKASQKGVARQILEEAVAGGALNPGATVVEAGSI